MMDVKKIPIILRFKLSALPAAKITSEIKKVETKIAKLTKEGKDEKEVLKELGDIDKLANTILEANNAKINVVKKPVQKEVVKELTVEEPVLKVAKKELSEDEKKVEEMKNRLKKSMNSTTGVSTEDDDGEKTEERVVAKEFTKQILDNHVDDKSAHTFISAGKNDKADMAKVVSGWVFIGSWALPLFELMHLLVLSSPFFILYMLIYLPLFGSDSILSMDGMVLVMGSLSLSIIGPVVFYYASKPFLSISSKMFKLTSKVVDTNMSLSQKNHPFMFVFNHNRIIITLVALAVIAVGLTVTFTVLSDSTLIDIINNNF